MELKKLSRNECLARIDAAISVYKLFAPLADSYMIDYFIDNHWDTLLSTSWRAYFDQCNPDWPWLLDTNPKSHLDTGPKSSRPPPLSMCALKRCTEVYSFGRLPDAELLRHAEESSGKIENWRHHCFRRVKLKKRAELSSISSLLAALLNHHPKLSENLQNAVDLGAGVGHLARRLALDHGLKARAVEADQKLVDTARLIDESWGRGAAEVADAALAVHHEAQWVQHDTNIASTDDSSTKSRSTLLVGLHTCGDLAATMARIFVHDIGVGALINASCCYMKLNGGSDNVKYYDWGLNSSRQSDGFPMSNTVWSALDKCNILSVSYMARELACHANERLASDLEACQVGAQSCECPTFGKEALHVEGRAHAFRAAAEMLIQECTPEWRYRPLKGIPRCTIDLTFPKYVALLSEANGIGSFPEEPVLRLSDRLSKDTCRSKVANFYTVRKLVAPLLETLFILDRVEFVRESMGDNNVSIYVVPFCDPCVSPRNLALVVVKNVLE